MGKLGFVDWLTTFKMYASAVALWEKNNPGICERLKKLQPEDFEEMFPEWYKEWSEKFN